MPFRTEEIARCFIGMKVPTKTFQAKKLTVNKKTKKPRMYTDPEFVKIKEFLRDQLIHYLKPYIKEKPYKCGIILDVMFCFNAENAGKEIGEMYTKKPDRDNLVKTIQDLLEKKSKSNPYGIGLIDNDSMIGDGRLSKFYEKYDGIYLVISKQVKEK